MSVISVLLFVLCLCLCMIWIKMMSRSAEQAFQIQRRVPPGVERAEDQQEGSNCNEADQFSPP